MTITVKTRLDTYAKLERLWTDERFTNGHSTLRVREFIEAYWWARITTPDDWWREMHRLAGRPDRYWSRSIYREDLPRWEPPTRAIFGCDVILPRAQRRCGRGGTSGRVTDPLTGQWRILTICKAHGGRNAPEFVAERRLDQTRLPKPHPNRGGILPSYIRANNWPDLYASVSPSWEPPAVGIVADDWPVMSKVIGEPLPKLSPSALRLIPGGRQTDEGDMCGPNPVAAQRDTTTPTPADRTLVRYDEGSPNRAAPAGNRGLTTTTIRGSEWL